jgi:anhydro-N-acetylmuramic acid kinase
MHIAVIKFKYANVSFSTIKKYSCITMQASGISRPILGIMSGTSLDGVDLALCSFIQNDTHLGYTFLQTQTVPFPPYWLEVLSNPFRLTAEELAQAHINFGTFLGTIANDFLKRQQTKPYLISSHGHTLFHKPDAGYTFQLGHGAAIAHTTGIDTVCDFRSGDVILGGQGAPLVPIGDEMLFGAFDGCLNLGGFSNISFNLPDKKRIGFDISPVNFVLNHLARQLNMPYDDGGKISASGNIIPELLVLLNALPFYKEKAPKSLGAEWVNTHIFPLLDSKKHSVEDLLRTFTEHTALQIADTATQFNLENILCTGGGAKNKFLLARAQAFFDGKFTVIDSKTTDFKEALVFALLGYLRFQNKTNVLASVTGASINSCSGAIYKAFPQAGY